MNLPSIENRSNICYQVIGVRPCEAHLIMLVIIGLMPRQGKYVHAKQRIREVRNACNTFNIKITCARIMYICGVLHKIINQQLRAGLCNDCVFAHRERRIVLA